jgi:trk system potassium uptake protein TrkH
MNLRPIRFVLGLILMGMAGFMVVPGIFAQVLHGHGEWEFFVSAALVAVLGLGLLLSGRGSDFQITARQAFVLTISSWLAMAFFGALPMVLISHIDYADAFFETMSGITTTGSTVLTDLDHTAASVLIWRSILQWIGGLGFILMAVALLPFLGVGGMRLFRTESSDWSDKTAPRARDMALRIGQCYSVITLACALAYFLAGMSVFDAINHAMCTVSTGGFSTSDASIGHFESPTIEWIAIVFMILGALPFSLYIKALLGDVGTLINDEQVRGFFAAFLGAVLLVFLWLLWRADLPAWDALRETTFSVVSVMTTTGFVSDDYTQWGTFSTMVFFLLMFVGGCSGSTAGAIKIFRFQLTLKVFSKQIRRLVHPRGVFVLRFNGNEIEPTIVDSLVAFSGGFFATITIVTLLLSAFDLDFITALSAATTAVTNVGPGIGNIVGPTGNFAAIPDGAKWILAAGMLLGRLEIMTVMVFLSKSFWRT